MNATRRCVVLMVWVTSLAALGCGDGGAPPALGSPRAELEAARQRWESRGVEDYDFRFRLACFCPPDLTQTVSVSVRRGTVRAVRSAASGQPVDPSLLVGDSPFRDIQGLFDQVQGFIDASPHRLSVTYDPFWGYPADVHVDLREHFVDDELSFSVSDLVPIR